MPLQRHSHLLFCLFLYFTGVGIGLCLQVGFSYFLPFFDKHFAVANMLSTASSGIGYLSIPPLMEFLISQYGWKGAFQIMSAVMAHLCACGLLLRASKREPQKQQSVHSSKISDDRPDKTRRGACVMFLKEVAKNFDLSLFRNVRFIAQSVVNGFLQGAMIATIIYLVPYARSVGVSPLKSSYLMIAYGVGNVIVRLSPVGVIVDKKIISASTLGGVLRFILGLVIIATPFTRTYKQLMTCAVLYGLLQGVGGCMLYVVVARSAGSRDKGPAASAWFLLQNGIGSTIIIYFVGKFCCEFL